MDHLNFAWSAPVLWALLGLLGVVMWNLHRQHVYLLWLAAAWLCAGVASMLAWRMHVPAGATHGLVGFFAWLAAILTAQAMARRFGRNVRRLPLAAISGLMLLGWGYFAYIHPSAQALQCVFSLGLALILSHVLLAIWRVALRHGKERALWLIYAGVAVLIALSPWLQRNGLADQAMLWLPWGAMVFSVAMAACVWAENPTHLRTEHDRDALTGLMRRQAFEQACGARPAEQGIRFMVLCDLDHFQRVNQQFGKTAGDEVLRQFAHLLQTSIRTGDVLARLGGEEFGVALRRIHPDDAHALVQRIVDTMAQQHWARKLAIGPLTASFGLVMVREEDSLDIALHRADVLLCQAKDAGCNRIATEDMVVEAELRFQ